MHSTSLEHWLNNRVPRLNEIDRRCATSQTLAPTNPLLHEENLRRDIVLLSARFQGFFRDRGFRGVNVASRAG